MRKLSLLLAASLSLSITPAFADGIGITVTPYLAANVYGSPSYPQGSANAQAAQYMGLSTYGAPGPSQFQANSNITSAQGIVTPFNSYQGVADPTGAYSQELGNRMSFGIAINGNGTQFSISQLSFSASSTDDPGDPSHPNGYLFFAHAPGFYNYNANYEGVLKGTDGILGTADDIFITSGPATQLVDALYGAGSGNSFEADCSGCTTTAQRQAAIDDVASYPGFPYTFTGTYSLAGTTASGSGTFNISPAGIAATPEPSSLILLGTGALGLAGAMRRRFVNNEQ